MKIKSNYVLQEVVDEYIVVPIGEEADRLHGVLKLNAVGAFIWKILSNGVDSEEEIKKLIMDEYNIDKFTAEQDITMFLKQLNEFGCLEY